MCQIENIDKMDCTDFFNIKIERLLFILRNPMTFISITVRKMKRYKTSKTGYLREQNKIYSTKKRSADLTYTNSSGLKAGDVVRIRSKGQILVTLDKNNKLEGCYFMDEMWQYCGSHQKVFKKIDYFFDESNLRMCKASNTVILEGLYCSGKRPYKLNCDRSCFVFWKEDWLEKIK